jgi:hypothetical protein
MSRLHKQTSSNSQSNEINQGNRLVEITTKILNGTTHRLQSNQQANTQNNITDRPTDNTKESKENPSNNTYDTTHTKNTTKKHQLTVRWNNTITKNATKSEQTQKATCYKK